MQFRVELAMRTNTFDARGHGVLQQIQALGIQSVTQVRVVDLFFLQGDLDQADVDELCARLLVDPVVQTAKTFSPSAQWQGPGDAHSVEVTVLPGVTDSVARSLMQSAHLLGYVGLAAAATGHRYEICGGSQVQVMRIAEQLLANHVIERYALDAAIEPPLSAPRPHPVEVEHIDLSALDAVALLQLSQQRRLSLDLKEMQAIQSYFRTQARPATDIELEMLAQTWSEHCVHKTFRALIDYKEFDSEGALVDANCGSIDSLLNTYIRSVTEQLDKPWVHSAFVDNAGIVAFNDDYDLAFKVETHNHPSALEPFGGANTGVGGVVRDVMGVSARPIANTDVLCFGPLDTDPDRLPRGVLHPRRVAAGVVQGVEDYGNKMGIPTVNGAILYDKRYTANPLVFCGCLGLLPRGSHRCQPQPGDLVVCIGGRTGRDGLRGATFSSMEMDDSTGELSGSAVQIGHPITEKQTLELILRARDAELYTAITDCGAGGLSSAVGEMAATLGAQIHLERVPLKYAGLQTWEIWLSEAQERMVLAVPNKHMPRLQQMCRDVDVEATVLGHFTGDGVLQVLFGERTVASLATDFLHNGIPRRHLDAEYRHPRRSLRSAVARRRYADVLLELLSHEDIRSKEEVIRRYDHEVQGASIIKPLVGVDAHGPSDAAVLMPLQTHRRGGEQAWRAVALAVGINPHIGALDPYCMAWAAVDEAVRNCVAVGADPDELSLLDNFCWGNPLLPDRLGSLVRCARGCKDAAMAFAAPFISGKDSFNNEYLTLEGVREAIPGTLLISAMALLPDARHAISMDLKHPGDVVYLVGTTTNALGASAYFRIIDEPGGEPPQPSDQGLGIARALHRAIAQQQVNACHDCSEGGIAVALAEMCLAAELGVEFNLDAIGVESTEHDDEIRLFSESLSRYLVCVPVDKTRVFEQTLGTLPWARVGLVRHDRRFIVRGCSGEEVINLNCQQLKQAFCGHCV